MAKNVVFKSGDESLTLSIEDAIKEIAKEMLVQGVSMVNVRVDDLHDGELRLSWLPKKSL